MTSSKIRLWFACAVAVIAAALADPLVEWASNAGCFGRGTFTDHSNLDVVPALLVGGVFVAMQLVVRVRRALSEPYDFDLRRAPSIALRGGIAKILPIAFVLQMAVLFCMETAEQFAVAGHSLGPAIWLGGPVFVSLGVHALACVAVAYALAAALFAFTRETVRVIRSIRAMAIRPAHGVPPIALPEPEGARSHALALVLCHIGERAPPQPVL